MTDGKLIFEELVTENHDEFIAEVKAIAGRLKFNPNVLMATMWKESRINHRAVNRNGGATGLIQFMPSTAIGLGTTTAKLRAMSNVQQLRYVEKYFKPYTGRLNSYFDLYLVVFFPVALSKPDNWQFHTSDLSAEEIGRANEGINGGRPITKISFRNYLLRGIDAKYHGYLS